MSDSAPTYFALIDMETTGLRMEDHIIEVAVILTDDRLNELGRYNTLVRPRPSTFARLLSAADQPIYKMHQASGLTKALVEADETTLPTMAEVDRDVRTLIDAHVPENAVVHLAGGGVAQFDQPRVKAFMPKTAARVHYRPIDFSVIAQSYETATGDTVTLSKPGTKAHRALDDIVSDLDVGRRIWDMLAEISGTPRPEQVQHSSMERVMRAASLADSLARDDMRDVQRLLDEQSPQDLVAGLSTITSHLATELAKARGVTIGSVLDEVRMIAARSQE